MLVFCVLAVPRGMWDLNIFQPGIKSEPCEVKDWSLNPWPPASPAYASFVRNCQAVFYTGCILTNNASSCSSAFSLAFGGVTFAYFQIGLFKKLSCLLYTLDRSPLWNRWFANILPLVVSCFRDFFFCTDFISDYVGSSLLHVSFHPVVVHGLLISPASLAAEHRL